MRLSAPVVVATIAISILAAIGTPNLRISMHRSRQKRTMAGVRDWGAAIEEVASRHLRGSQTLEGTSLELSTLAAKRKLPLRDGWGTPYRIRANAKSYMVQAAGRDHVFEKITTTEIVKSYDNDIAFADGSFVRFPEGI